MASGGARSKTGSQKDRKRGSAAGIVAGGAVALGLGAALAYGAKKLYDYLTDEKDSPENVAAQKASSIDQFYADASYRGNAASGDAGIAGASSSDVPDMPLQANASLEFPELLQEYYMSYVCIPGPAMKMAQAVVDDIRLHILEHVQKEQPQLGVSELTLTGSCREGLKVITPDEFDVLIPLYLENSGWTLLPSSHTPGYYRVHQKEETQSLSSPFDACVVGDGYLSPQAIQQAFQGIVQDALNGYSHNKVQISGSNRGIMIHVQYTPTDSLWIGLRPAVVLDDKLVTAQPHHDLYSDDPVESDYATLWRESFSVREFDYMTHSLPPSSCHRTLLRIFKAIRLNFPHEFGVFSSYIYKTVLMHMIESGEADMWKEECLQECIVDFLDNLQGYLLKKNLPHFFNAEINLLDEHSQATCDNVRKFIRHIMGENQLRTLLERREYHGKEIGTT